MKKQHFLILILPLLIFLWVSFFNVLSGPECLFKKYVDGVLKRNGIELYVKNPHYKNLYSFEFDELVVRKFDDSLNVRLTNAFVKLSLKSFDLGFSGFSFKNSNLVLSTSKEIKNKLNFKFDYKPTLLSCSTSVNSIFFSTSSNIVGYLLGIANSNERTIRVDGVSLVGSGVNNSYRGESNYLEIDINDFNPNLGIYNLKLKAPRLYAGFENISLTLYDLETQIISQNRKNDCLILSQSMDIASAGNNLLTIDDVDIKLALIEKNLKMNLKSNLVTASAIYDIKMRLGEGKFSLFSSQVCGNFNFDLSQFNFPKLSSNVSLDFTIPVLKEKLKGDFDFSLTGSRAFLTSKGLKVNDYIELIPYLDFDIKDTDKQAFMNILLKDRQYCVAKINFSRSKSLPNLSFSFSNYDLDVNIKGERRKYYITSPNIFDIAIDYFKVVKVKANINYLHLPILSKSGFDDIILTLNTGFEINGVDSRIDKTYINCLYKNYKLTSAFSYIKNVLNIDKISFNDNNEVWQGLGTIYIPKSLKPKDFTFNFTLFEELGDGRLMLSGNKVHEFNDYFVKADNVRLVILKNLGISEFNSSINLRTDFKSIQMASGYIKTFDNNGDDFLSGVIDFDGSNVRLDNAYFEVKGAKFKDLSLIIDGLNKSLILKGDVVFPYKRFDRTLDFKSHVNAKLTAQNINFENPLKTLDNLALKGELFLSKVFFDDIKFPNFNTNLDYSKKKLSLNGENINILANLQKDKWEVGLGVTDINSPINFSANIKKKGTETLVSLNLVSLSPRLLTSFLINPIINVYECGLSGWANICISSSKIDMHCNLHSNQMVLDTIWLENERFTINDVSIIANGRLLELTCQNANALNVVTKKYNRISKLKAGMYFESGDMVPFWFMDTSIPLGSTVQVNMPIIPANFTLDVGKASGDFYISGRGMGDIDINTDLFVEDVTMSTPSRHPKWFFQKNPKTGVVKNIMNAPIELKGTITCGKNVSLSYPRPDNSLFNAVVKPGSSSKVFYSDKTKEISIETPIDLERGEVFYFNKKFVIEEGSFSWPSKKDDDFLGFASNNMNLNIVSSLRDSDDSGNPIDLYLSLKNANMENLEPIFSASIPMTQSEILYRFGQNIYNTTSTNRDESYKAGADLAINATMALGTLGGAANFSLGGNFGPKLGLDVWTFRTAMLTQFLTDSSLILAGRSYSKSTSSFARYLDKTSITIGKNFNKSQSINLQLEFRNITNPLVKLKGIELSSGIYLGFDLAYRWNSPIARFELSSSLQDLSIPSILENFKISINRSFVL